MNPSSDEPPQPPPADLIEGVDFYREREWVVFTQAYHKRRGYCCRSGCRHCPYGFDPEMPDPTPRPNK